MLKNIGNYSALVLLTLVILANAVSAGSVSDNAHRFGPVKIEDKASSFYTKFLTSGESQSYIVTLREGQQTTIKIRSDEGVSIKLHLPSGGVKEYREDKSFNLEFQSAGEYVIELHSASISKYTLKASIK